ncbi:MAG: succinate dehydrogenase / fumarate reductase cytochrome b subunit [Bacteroidia bacterium]|jgi:succinate dehydrogenase / fumarate reductase cytochrome b subunit
MSNHKGTTSVGRKILMALSGLFLIVFLLQHCAINFSSVIAPDMFNDISHFMGTNPIIQYLLQPVLAFGVFFHLIMGIYLELQNRNARPIKYAVNKPATNSTWMSRNMIITGIMVLLFLALHFYDFWLPELNTKYIVGDMSGLDAAGEFRYMEELAHKFTNIGRVIIYVLAFVFLSLHLLHGFQSAFQSVGFNHNKFTPTLKKLGILYAVLIPALFIAIALFHYFNQHA